MRDISDVMDAILAEVPEDFEDRIDLENAFNSIRTSAMYTPPAAQQLLWIRLAEALGDSLGSPDAPDPWIIRIAAIFSGTEPSVRELG